MRWRRKIGYLTVVAMAGSERGVCLEVGEPVGILNICTALTMPLRFLGMAKFGDVNFDVC
jgi:hypothetical protein